MQMKYHAHLPGVAAWSTKSIWHAFKLALTMVWPFAVLSALIWIPLSLALTFGILWFATSTGLIASFSGIHASIIFLFIFFKATRKELDG